MCSVRRLGTNALTLDGRSFTGVVRGRAAISGPDATSRTHTHRYRVQHYAAHKVQLTHALTSGHDCTQHAGANAAVSCSTE